MERNNSPTMAAAKAHWPYTRSVLTDDWRKMLLARDIEWTTVDGHPAVRGKTYHEAVIYFYQDGAHVYASTSDPTTEVRP